MCQNTDQEQWRERFRAVGKAQSRYLWILLIAGVFYFALDRSIPQETESSRQKLPLIGIEVDSKVVWASGSLVLSLIALAALGTFPAITYASSNVNASGDGRAFERLDTHPTAIDFIVYAKPGASKWANLGLVTYPLFITICVAESMWLWVRLAGSKPFYNWHWVFLLLGGVAILASLPRLIRLWISKVGSMLKMLKRK